jgi:predicted flavoprotein YhiN
MTGRVTVQADAVVLALGGASWKRLGSDGAWAEMLAKRGVALEPFAPSNCGFLVQWSAKMAALLAEFIERGPIDDPVFEEALKRNPNPDQRSVFERQDDDAASRH